MGNYSRNHNFIKIAKVRNSQIILYEKYKYLKLKEDFKKEIDNEIYLFQKYSTDEYKRLGQGGCQGSSVNVYLNR